MNDDTDEIYHDKNYTCIMEVLKPIYKNSVTVYTHHPSAYHLFFYTSHPKFKN